MLKLHIKVHRPGDMAYEGLAKAVCKKLSCNVDFFQVKYIVKSLVLPGMAAKNLVTFITSLLFCSICMLFLHLYDLA